uniref:Mucin 15, cell surface associated n=2 Tax=Phocoena sinus TaxID=42100 RepID=A0A8C9C1M7_PHOSS
MGITATLFVSMGRYSHLTPIPKKITMLTSVKILLISILFSLLLFGSHGEEGREINTTQNIAEDLKTRENQSIPLESEANSTSDKKNRETSHPKATNFSFGDPSNKTHGTDFYHNLSTDNSSSLKLMPTLSPSPPLSHSFVSKLPRNSSVADENPLPASAPPDTTAIVSSENFTRSSVNDTMKAPDNSSITVSNLPSRSNTISVTPMIMETDGWPTMTGDSLAGFTAYQETTLYPTLKLTNNSKIFPDTSDPQEVLRLDNAPEPYDVSFGNSSYYNPTANDSSTPAGRENARDGIPMDDIPPLRTSV